MRRFAAVPALTMALAAGCASPEADQSGNAAAEPAAAAEAPAKATDPAPPPPPVLPATGKTIPATLLGVYDASLEACGEPSDARLTVSPAELRFHESIGTVRQVTATGADTVTVEADYQGEGERWRSLRELKLSDAGSTLTVSGDGTRLVRVRCPEGTR